MNGHQKRQAIIAAAMRWWDTKAPVGWGRVQHATAPTVNCTSLAQRDLAQACAAWWMHPADVGEITARDADGVREEAVR
jgi:hypothetical protein